MRTRAPVLAALAGTCLALAPVAAAQPSADSTHADAGNLHVVAIDCRVFATALLHTATIGGGLGVRYYPHPRWSTGIAYALAEQPPEETFGYSIGKPVLDLSTFYWVNQFDLLRKGRLAIAASLANGLAVLSLGDNAGRTGTYTPQGRRTRPKPVAANYMYAVQPGIYFCFRLWETRRGVGFHLTAEGNYRFLAGGTKFGSSNDFQGYCIGAGIAIMAAAQ